MKTLATLIAGSLLTVGCATARTPTAYREDTQKLLDAKSSDIKTCYDGVLTSDQKAAGKVTVKFAFKASSGELLDPKIDPAATTAPSSVSQCVLSSLNGIVLTPGDKHRGDATWSWNFDTAR
ncbi:MAG: hypothetical protein ABI321_14860 [Polyangia bacterium]